MISDTQKTQSDSVADQIRRLILNGRFRPGQPLRQDALSEQLNVSRTPLRHALQSLADDGLVEMSGYKGAKVARFDRQMVIDLFEMRLLLEPLALESAFKHHSKVDFAKAEIALDAAEAGQEPSKLSELNWDFHHALYRPSDRHTLLKSIERLNKASALAEVIANSIAIRPEKSAAEHRELLHACRTGDKASAISLLREHLQLAYHDIQNGKE